MSLRGVPLNNLRFHGCLGAILLSTESHFLGVNPFASWSLSRKQEHLLFKINIKKESKGRRWESGNRTHILEGLERWAKSMECVCVHFLLFPKAYDLVRIRLLLYSELNLWIVNFLLMGTSWVLKMAPSNKEFITWFQPSEHLCGETGCITSHQIFSHAVFGSLNHKYKVGKR